MPPPSLTPGPRSTKENIPPGPSGSQTVADIWRNIISPLGPAKIGRPRKVQIVHPSTCNVCGFDPKTTVPDSLAAKTNIVMAVLGYLHITIGAFLLQLFDGDEMSHLTQPTRISLTRFLGGTSALGTRPVDVVDAIYRHPYGCEHDRSAQPIYNHPLPPYAQPPNTSALDSESDNTDSEPTIIPSTSNHAHNALRTWAISLVASVVNGEVTRLAQDPVLRPSDMGITWSFLFDFSMATLQTLVIEKAPVLWTIITSAFIGEK